MSDARRGPIAIKIGAMMIALLAVYVAGYFRNLRARSTILYTNPHPMGLGQRAVPRYRVGQIPSEILFWPIHEIDRLFRPEWFSEPNEIRVENDWR